MTNTHEVFTYPMIIREHHLDTFGHVNNAVYLQLFEEARWEVATSRGYGIKTIRETGQGPTILEIHLRFLRELRLRANVTIHTQLISYEGKVGHMRQWILDEKNETCCDAEFKFGLFDVTARKLVPPTPAWLKVFGPEADVGR